MRPSPRPSAPRQLASYLRHPPLVFWLVVVVAMAVVTVLALGAGEDLGPTAAIPTAADVAVWRADAFALASPTNPDMLPAAAVEASARRLAASAGVFAADPNWRAAQDAANALVVAPHEPRAHEALSAAADKLRSL